MEKGIGGMRSCDSVWGMRYEVSGTDCRLCITYFIPGI